MITSFPCNIGTFLINKSFAYKKLKKTYVPNLSGNLFVDFCTIELATLVPISLFLASRYRILHQHISDYKAGGSFVLYYEGLDGKNHPQYHDA